MIEKLSTLVDRASDFFAHRKGLLPLLGLVLVLVNFSLQFLSESWLTQTNCFLHLGLVLAIVGFLLAKAL